MRPMLLLAISAFLTGMTLGSPARADNEFDVAVANGVITVTAKAGWHINKDFPWKATIGDTKLDKSKFTLAETTATLTDAPKGSATLKGAVCSADQCHSFQKELTIK